MSGRHTQGPLHIQQDSKWPYTISICTHSGEPIHSEPLICSSSAWKNLDDARNLVGIHGDEREHWRTLMDRQMADMLLRAAAPDLLAAVEFLLARVSAHKPGCSLSEVPTCDCGDWNIRWEAARTALARTQPERHPS